MSSQPSSTAAASASSVSSFSSIHSSELDSRQLQSIYRWIDSIPLSKPKKNISRDFSDGTLISEVIHHFLPRYVELHNYSASNSIAQKHYNWKTLNQKLFRRLQFSITTEEIDSICLCKKGAIERLLWTLNSKLNEYMEKKKREEELENHLLNSGNNNNNNKGNNGNHNGINMNNPLIFPHSNPSASHEKDILIGDLRETVDILSLKVQKLEQLLRLKNTKIATLQQEIENYKNGN